MTGGDPDPPSGSGRGRLPSRLRYKPMGAAYQGALEAVFAIVGTTAAGWYADAYFDTSPWLLVGGATIGFAAFVLRLTRLGSALNQAESGERDGSPPEGADGASRPDDDEAGPSGAAARDTDRIDV